MQRTNANDPLRTTDHDPNVAMPRPDVNSDFESVSPVNDEGTRIYVPGGSEPIVAVPQRGPGTVLVPGYEIEGVLGRGGMGVVYKARHLVLKRTVALKLMLGGGHTGLQELARFRIEAEAVARLQHPNIVQIHEFGEADGHPYCALEFVEGGNLAEKIDGNSMPARDAARLVETLARAMQFAHSRNVVHRDLKPANVLLAADGTPRITDFGLARQMDNDSGETQAGSVMGTPSYMAPEQASGCAHEAGPAADVYALGAILYDCLTGRPPFKGKTIVETLDQVRTKEAVPPSRWQARVPLDLDTICLKCLEKNPAERYPTAGALAADLGRWAAGEPVSVRAAGLVERAAKWVRRKPTLAAAYTLGLLTLLFGGMGALAVSGWRAAATARASAEKALDGEATARAAADKAREELARVEYSRTMEVAYQEWRDDNVATSLALLDSTREDLRGWEWRYLHRLCHSDLVTLGGHPSPIESASLNPDGSLIATIGGPNESMAKMWDAQTGAVVFTLKGHTDYVSSASFSHDGSWVVTASWDKTAKVWDTRSGAEFRTLKGHTDPVNSASFSPDGSQVVTVSGYTMAKVWNVETGTELFTLNGVNLASFSKDGLRIVTTGKTAKVWDAKTGAEVFALKGHTEYVSSASFSPDGSRIVTTGDDNAGKVWDAKTGAEVFALQGHVERANSASFSLDGSRIVTISRDTTGKVWDAQTGAELLMLKGHIASVVSASFSPDGLRVVTTSMDKTARVWNVQTGAVVLMLKGHTAPVVSASFSRDGSRIVTVSSKLENQGSDGTAKVWDAKNGTEFLTFNGIVEPGVPSASFSPDGTRVVVADAKTARVWDAKTGAGVFALKPDDSDKPFFRPEEWQEISGYGSWASASFSPDGSRILTASADKTAKIWDAHSGAELFTFKGPSGVLASFSPDGSRIVTSSLDVTSPKVWDVQTGAELLTLKGHTGVVTSISFSPDRSRIVTASWDKTAKIWDAQTGVQALTLKHTGLVFSASFSSDGSRIVTASNDKTVKIWDATPINRDFLASKPTSPPGTVK